MARGRVGVAVGVAWDTVGVEGRDSTSSLAASNILSHTSSTSVHVSCMATPLHLPVHTVRGKWRSMTDNTCTLWDTPTLVVADRGSGRSWCWRC